MALAVNPKLDYVELEVTGATGDGAELDADDPRRGRFIVAAGLKDSVFAGLATTVVAEMKGTDLLGQRYVPPFDFATPESGDPFRVVPADFVTLDQGTGVVHIAPAFGEDDYRIGQAENTGFLQLITPDGKFVEAAGEFAGRFCKEADRDLIRDLRARGLLFSEAVVNHEYPFCWRADEEPLIQYARKSWFIRTSEKIDEVIANNRKTKWYPAHIQEGRFGDFLREQRRLGALPGTLLGYAAQHLDQRRDRRDGRAGERRRDPRPQPARIRRVRGGAREGSEPERTPPRPQAVDRQRHVDEGRRAGRVSSRARSDRLLVRLGLHAVRPVGFPAQEPR